eukprot:Colp12_sorted_trinity150504_noHs@29619
MADSFEYVDLDGISEHLKCPICFDPFIDPMTCPHCTNSVCREHAEVEIRSGRKKCPMCRKPWQTMEVLLQACRALRHMLDDLLVVCPSDRSHHVKRGEFSQHPCVSASGSNSDHTSLAQGEQATNDQLPTQDAAASSRSRESEAHATPQQQDQNSTENASAQADSPAVEQVEFDPLLALFGVRGVSRQRREIMLQPRDVLLGVLGGPVSLCIAAAIENRRRRPSLRDFFGI